MIRNIRVYAKPTSDNADLPSFIIDVSVDVSDEVIGLQPLLGMQGAFGPAATQECYPFVLYRGGRVDFGTGYDSKPNERYGQLDLLAGPIKEGRLVTFSGPNCGKQTFRISMLQELPLRRTD